MILTCPSCATSYFTPDEAIGENGRKVRCRSCSHVWHATLVEEPLELSEAPDMAALRAQAGFGRRDDAPESLAETPAPELPKAFRARAEEQRRVRRAATHGAVWAGLASVFVAILGAAWLFRVEVVDLYPRAAAAYAAVGTPVNATGLDFEAMSIKVAPYDPAKVIVSGAIRNIRDREIQPPPVRVALLDAHGVEIGFKIIPINTAPVLPGGVQGFAAVVPDPTQKIVGIGVDFAPEPASPARVSSEPAAAAHDEVVDAHALSLLTVSEPVHRPLPVADSKTSLRPAINRTAVSAQMAPVDARPVDASAH
jgi:predicted Zn finger-like uncharacterized protein